MLTRYEILLRLFIELVTANVDRLSTKNIKADVYMEVLSADKKEREMLENAAHMIAADFLKTPLTGEHLRGFIQNHNLFNEVS